MNNITHTDQICMEYTHLMIEMRRLRAAENCAMDKMDRILNSIGTGCFHKDDTREMLQYMSRMRVALNEAEKHVNEISLQIGGIVEEYQLQMRQEGMLEHGGYV